MTKHVRHARGGLTLIELVLALGLFSLLMVAVFQLIDRSLTTWRTGETRRSLLEMSSSVLEQLSNDFAGLEPGARGDFVLEWVAFDTDGNGTMESKWPRDYRRRAVTLGEIAPNFPAAAHVYGYPVVLPPGREAWNQWLRGDWKRARDLIQPYASSLMVIDDG